jgi:hypothetical protein
LIVAGAIMDYAITASATGFDINAAGQILLVVGLALVVIAIGLIAFGSRTSTTSREDIQNTPGGQVRTTEQDQFDSRV